MLRFELWCFAFSTILINCPPSHMNEQNYSICLYAYVMYVYRKGLSSQCLVYYMSLNDFANVHYE